MTTGDIHRSGKIVRLAVLGVTALGVCGLVYAYYPKADPDDLPNRIPEAAPYVTAEARAFPPPYEERWTTDLNPGQCQNCHQKIFDQWNGSMMSNSWRDPVWRAAFLLLARATSTNGECDAPAPPDGTARAVQNPFANKGECSSTFDTGTGKYKVSRPGSLLDAFCSRCHMPTNYVDNVPIRNVEIDPVTGRESARVDPRFNPTSDAGTGLAFATLETQYRNTASGKTGIFCAVCHSTVATRETPFHNYARGGNEYTPAVGPEPRSKLVLASQLDQFDVADATQRNLGYGVGAGAYQLSPHAIGTGERFGPLAAKAPGALDVHSSEIFQTPIPYQGMDASKHKGFHHAMIVRAEMCATCHDVTNALPIKNPLGKWVGGFPIERTYTEWANSRYADRPGNTNYDPAYKRECQSCHMQQDYGQPGTAQTLYMGGHPLPPPVEKVASDGGAPRPFYTHHFVGGNTLVPRLVGKSVDKSGTVAPYPELSAFSFTSADHKSVYSRALWTRVDDRGAPAQQARLAWDRLRHVLSMNLGGPSQAAAGTTVPVSITVSNTGSGHNFPTGFPEGRTAWIAVHAYDLATGKELLIRDAQWKRDSLGVGNLTHEDQVDPNFPGCNWIIPAGSADPYSFQLKAVASLGDGCPTLALPYATPLNLATNAQGLPIDAKGQVVDKKNPSGLPVFKDLNGNGDVFDDSFLRDTRLRPMPHPGATLKLDRYAVVIPPGTAGPVAVTAAVYYQSVEAVVALKVLGNMADTNNDFLLQSCVLGGACDGRKPSVEPAVVEGSPPVPMIIRSWVIDIDGAPPPTAPIRVAAYPQAGATRVYADVVVKAFFSEPVSGVDSQSFTLTDSQGAPVPAWVDPIGPGTWGLFPNQVFMKPGETYTARVKHGVCDVHGARCTPDDVVWSFTISDDPNKGAGDTSVPMGFELPGPSVVWLAERGPEAGAVPVLVPAAPAAEPAVLPAGAKKKSGAQGAVRRHSLLPKRGPHRPGRAKLSAM
jgi:hypothetical protein